MQHNLRGVDTFCDKILAICIQSPLCKENQHMIATATFEQQSSRCWFTSYTIMLRHGIVFGSKYNISSLFHSYDITNSEISNKQMSHYFILFFATNVYQVSFVIKWSVTATLDLTFFIIFRTVFNKKALISPVYTSVQ